MIEFKAECGHTIRANDDDAGGVVQCSYCGREASVPISLDNNLDYLYADVENETSDPRPSPLVRTKRGRRGRARRHRGPTQANPWQIVLYMCYAAALFVLVVVVGKEFFLPLFEKGGVSRRLTEAPVGEDNSSSPQERTSVVQEQTTPLPMLPGLIRGGACTGIYFSSVPSRADVYVLEADDAPTTGSIRDVPGCVQTVAAGQWETKWKGDLVIEVSLPWSHSELMDSSLPFARQYWAFRRAIHKASDEDRRRQVAQFFIPDSASDTFIHESSPDQLEIVRQYRGIQVDRGGFAVVRAVFLPAGQEDGAESFRIGDLIDHYLPKMATYSFDKDYVRRELGFWGVPQSDHAHVITALERIGTIPTVTEDGATRVFMIDVCDGQVTTMQRDDDFE